MLSDVTLTSYDQCRLCRTCQSDSNYNTNPLRCVSLSLLKGLKRYASASGAVGWKCGATWLILKLVMEAYTKR